MPFKPIAPTMHRCRPCIRINKLVDYAFPILITSGQQMAIRFKSSDFKCTGISIKADLQPSFRDWFTTSDTTSGGGRFIGQPYIPTILLSTMTASLGVRKVMDDIQSASIGSDDRIAAMPSNCVHFILVATRINPDF